MKEVLRHKPAAVALSIGLALGLTACSNPFEQTDPNQISACPDGWVNVDPKLHGSHEVNDMGQAIGALEYGRTQLVDNIKNSVDSTDNLIFVDSVPPLYSQAATLLIGKFNDSMYDTTDNLLATPNELFCKSDRWIPTRYYQSPAYVRAAAALEASGIPVDQSTPPTAP